jgi:hypothetical protein
MVHKEVEDQTVYMVVVADSMDDLESSCDRDDGNQEDSIPARNVRVSWTGIYFACDASVPEKEYRGLERRDKKDEKQMDNILFKTFRAHT